MTITITDLAARHGLTLRALRFYEERGLIGPERKGRARLYNDEDAARVALIVKATALGFTLSETRGLLLHGHGALSIPPAVARARLALMRARLDETALAIKELRALAGETETSSVREAATA